MEKKKYLIINLSTGNDDGSSDIEYLYSEEHHEKAKEIFKEIKADAIKRYSKYGGGKEDIFEDETCVEISGYDFNAFFNLYLFEREITDNDLKYYPPIQINDLELRF